MGVVTITPLLLEKLARQIGYSGPDLAVPCSEGAQGIPCKLPVFGHWIDTSSFRRVSSRTVLTDSLFTKSVMIVTQIASLLVLGPKTDDPRTRKIVFASCIYFGAFASMLLFFLPYLDPSIQPYIAVLLTMCSSNSYVIAVMCFTSWLPIIAKNIYVPQPTDEGVLGSETEPLLEQPVDLVTAPPGLSGLMAKMSSVATTMDAFGGVTVFVSLQWLLDHTRVGVPSCLAALALWWATVGTIPAVFLPGQESSSHIVKPKQVAKQSAGELFRSLGRLPQISKLLVAHFVACDLLMIIPVTLGLYSTTHLNFTVADVLGLTVFISIVAFIWTPLQPVIQRLLGTSNLQMLIVAVVCAFVSPLLGCSSVFGSSLGIRTKWHCYIAALGYAIATGPYTTYSRALVSELTPKGYESSFASLYLLSSRSVSFLGSLILGAIVQATGRFDFAWLFFAITTLVTLPLFASIDMKQGVKEADAYAGARTEDQSDS